MITHSIPSRIMKIVRGYGRGTMVFTWKDFEKLGERAAIDKALSRLTKNGDLRRVARGFYDLPRESKLLKGPAPASASDILHAIERRDDVVVRADNLAAANELGLTTAVSVQARYRSTGGRRNIRLDNSVIELRPAGVKINHWLRTPAAPAIQALSYVGASFSRRSDVSAILRDRLSSEAKRALKGSKSYRPMWMTDVIQDIISGNEDKTARC
jgi:hypothetical protein